MAPYVIVKKMNGSTEMMEVDSSTTAGDLIRRVIENDRSINQEDVQLVCDGSPLENDEKILEYVDGSGNMIDLVYTHVGGEN